MLDPLPAKSQVHQPSGRAGSFGLALLVIAAAGAGYLVRRADAASPFEVASATLSALTLFWLIVYTRAALRTADAAVATGDAANEQAEALQRPCVVFVAVPRDDIRQIMDAPFATELPRGDVTVVNVGPGPALGLSIFSEQKSGVALTSGLQFDLPYLEHGATHAFVTTGGVRSGEWRLTLLYRSMSGREYLTVCRLEDGAFTSTEFRAKNLDDKLPVPDPSPWEKAKAEAVKLEAEERVKLKAGTAAEASEIAALKASLPRD